MKKNETYKIVSECTIGDQIRQLTFTGHYFRMDKEEPANI